MAIEAVLLVECWASRQVAQPTDALRLNPTAARRPHPARRTRAEGQKGHTLAGSQKGDTARFGHARLRRD